VGTVRLVTLWPFNERVIREVAESTKNIIVTDMNLGQMVGEVQRVVECKVPVHFIGNAGGETIDPAIIVEKIMEVGK
jgi:2-oxoglutarate ferredoxin oxidoreductase subunit alpha